MLRPTVSRPDPSVAYDQIFIIVRRLRVCWCGVFSLTRGRVCRLQLLLALASASILWSESLGSCDHMLLSQIRDFETRRPTVEVFDPASTRGCLADSLSAGLSLLVWRSRNHLLQQLSYRVSSRYRVNNRYLYVAPETLLYALPRNRHLCMQCIASSVEFAAVEKWLPSRCLATGAWFCL
jgi:hypothetical protein